jgi:hypothetical protein
MEDKGERFENTGQFISLDAGLQGDFTRIILNGQGVPWSSDVKYMGVTIDKRLTFASHAGKSIEKAKRAIRILYSFRNRKSKPCLYNKLLLYKSCIRPFCVMSCQRQKKKLQIIQNKCLKIIKNRHWRYSKFDRCTYDRSFWREDL